METQLANLTFEHILVRGNKGESRASVLFDTGATLSFISLALAQRIATIVRADRAMNIVLADRSKVVIDKMALASVDLNGRLLTDHFYVMETAAADLILGMTTLRKYQVQIQTGQDGVFALIDGQPVESGVKSDDELSLPADPDIIDALKMPAGSTLREVRHRIAYLKTRQAEYLERDIQEAVANAIAVDRLGESKLWPKEKDWAVEFGRDNGLECLLAFIRLRQPITPAVRRIYERAKQMEHGRGDESVDDVQRIMNAQLRLGEETFKKYNTPTKVDASIDATQRHINLQMGISDALFHKYNP